MPPTPACQGCLLAASTTHESAKYLLDGRLRGPRSAVGPQQFRRELSLANGTNAVACGSVDHQTLLNPTNAQIVSFASSRSAQLDQHRSPVGRAAGNLERRAQEGAQPEAPEGTKTPGQDQPPKGSASEWSQPEALGACTAARAGRRTFFYNDVVSTGSDGNTVTNASADVGHGSALR
jgi:hypothetical protein